MVLCICRWKYLEVLEQAFTCQQGKIFLPFSFVYLHESKNLLRGVFFHRKELTYVHAV